MHHPIHHHFDHPSHLMNFFGYVTYAILVIGVSLVIAALAFDGPKDTGATPSPTTQQTWAQTEAP